MQAGYRIFGSKPGAYGAGLQGIMDSGNWQGIDDIATAFLNWGQYAYGSKAKGEEAREHLVARLKLVEAIVHNQDNREHDLLDSDDYYQFEGGLTATATALSGHQPINYHNDHSRPERPVAKTLDEEIAKVMRSRVVNPKWISGVMRHGYKARSKSLPQPIICSLLLQQRGRSSRTISTLRLTLLSLMMTCAPSFKKTTNMAMMNL